MRILQVSPYYPPHVGGIEYHVEALSQELVKAGHEVVVYTSNVPKSSKYEVVAGVEIYRFNCPFAPLNNPIMPGLFFKLVSRSSFDVIHTHGHFHMSSNLVAFSNVFTRRPFVLTSHGAILGYRGWRGVIEAFYRKTVGKWTLRSANKVIALTPTLANMLEDLGADRSNIVVVPFWMDLNEINPQTDVDKFRSTYKLGERQTVLFVGRLLPIKGLGYLIEAAKYAKTRPAIVIIGDEAPGYSGTKRALEEKVRALGLDNDIFFLGKFSREDLGVAYTAADLFVLPSLGEGMPLALLEAMASGKCVLATNVLGNKDVVKDGWNGLLVESKNAAQLAEKIDLLLTDSALRERLGYQARQDIEQNYSSEAVLGRILTLYQEIHDKRRRA
jgi:glycosyltransferase involved in cell wall biosynthesis